MCPPLFTLCGNEHKLNKVFESFYQRYPKCKLLSIAHFTNVINSGIRGDWYTKVA
jgi:hypothetical protein